MGKVKDTRLIVKYQIDIPPRLLTLIETVGLFFLGIAAFLSVGFLLHWVIEGLSALL